MTAGKRIKPFRRHATSKAGRCAGVNAASTKGEWRYKIFNHRWNCSPVLSVRDGKWKLLFNPDGSRSELYDMESDPFEESNQALQHPDTVARLKGITLEWQASLPESPLDAEAGAQPVKWPKAYNPAEKYLDRNLIF